MNRRSLAVLVCVFALALAGIAGSLLLRRLQSAVGRAATIPLDSEPAGESAAESSPALRIIRLTEQQVQQFGIETRTAGPGRLRIQITLPGEVALNADRVAHVVPRVSGVVKEVRKNLGDIVRQGEVLAVIESRELADVRAALLAARERVILSQSNFTREERLWAKKITPEQDYIQARNSLAEAGIQLRTAEQKLAALGFSGEYIAQLSNREDQGAITYEITAPFGGTITEKHASLGEGLRDDSSAFIVADLSTVWVNLDVHQKDLPLIRVGQQAFIAMGSDMPETQGRIGFLEPMATETNRTIHARVVLDNADGRYRPGLFVSGRVRVEDLQVSVLVPQESLVLVDGETCVFVREAAGFAVRKIVAGRNDSLATEVVRGLAPGEVYVSKGGFTLKSEIGKPEPER